MREKGFASGRIEGMIMQKLEGINRSLITLIITEPDSQLLALQGDKLEGTLL